MFESVRRGSKLFIDTNLNVITAGAVSLPHSACETFQLSTFYFLLRGLPDAGVGPFPPNV